MILTNYDKELRIEVDIRKKEKLEKAANFVERTQKKARTALRKAQEEMKQQANKERREVEEWKKGDRIMLSTKDLMFKKQPVKKLIERYVGSYIIEIVLANIIKLRLPESMRIYPVVNISWVIRYRKPVEEQKVKEVKLIEV